MADVKRAVKHVYIGTLYRFGYDLRVVTTAKAEAFYLLMDAYDKAYYQRNGFNSLEALKADPQMGAYFRKDRANAQEDIDINKVDIGKVEWT